MAAEIDAAKLMELYKALEGRKPDAKGIADMTPEERAAYNREAKRRSRERQRASLEAGSPVPTTDNIRAVLADAALVILARDAPGADIVMRALSVAFSGRAGVPRKVRADARSGKLSLKTFHLLGNGPSAKK